MKNKKPQLVRESVWKNVMRPEVGRFGYQPNREGVAAGSRVLGTERNEGWGGEGGFLTTHLKHFWASTEPDREGHADR